MLLVFTLSSAQKYEDDVVQENKNQIKLSKIAYLESFIGENVVYISRTTLLHS